MPTKNEKNNYIYGLICVIILAGIFYYFTVYKNKEGFESNSSTGQNIEEEILQQYMNNSLDDMSDEDYKRKIAGLRARLAKFGLYPSANTPDMSKYALKSQLNPEDGKCNVATAEDRDKYILKSAVPEPKCPGVDMSKYVLKSSIQPEKICPPPKEIDYSRYVLKSTIPPAQKCPPCICPKVKVSAGLCKACPPPPKASCPEVKPCPNQKCPEPKPCPVSQPPEKCHSVKYIKVPLVLKKTVQVNERGEIINETEETVDTDGNGIPDVNNNNNNGNGIPNVNNNNFNNSNNNNNNNVRDGPSPSNETEDERSQSINLGRYYNNRKSNRSITDDVHDPDSELLNNNAKAYNNNKLDAHNPNRTPLSDAISSSIADQNNASITENHNGASLNEIANRENVNKNNGTQLFNASTQPTRQVAQPHFTSTLEKPPRNTVSNNMLADQPKGLAEKCGPLKFNNVFRKYGVYGSQTN